MPHAFTEQGVAMLSGILNSDRAIAVNIQIMRTFTKLRHISTDNKDLRQELAQLREQTDERFQIVFETLDQLLTVDNKDLEMTDILGRPVKLEPGVGFSISGAPGMSSNSILFSSTRLKYETC